ncbi:MAG: putative RDD family membrane protein YckC [Bradymonadia bacterium]|jgi:uncharacterized RDD family membrane protein YckC
MSLRHKRPALWRRAFATVVDCVPGVLLAFGWIQTTSWRPFALIVDPTLPVLERLAITWSTQPGSFILGFTALHVPWVIWMSIFSLLDRESPGAHFFGLRLVDLRGYPAGRGRRLARSLALISWPLTGYLGFLLMWVHPSRRGVWDILSGLFCVRRTPRGSST